MPGDANDLVTAPSTTPSRERRPESSIQARTQCPGSSKDGLDPPHPLLPELELHIVDLADRLPVAVNYLSVEEISIDVKVHYCPAFDSRMSGMAATLAMTITTRKIEPNVFPNHPLMCLPI